MEKLFDKQHKTLFPIALIGLTKLKMLNTNVKLMQMPINGWMAISGRCSHNRGIVGMKR